jgi:hypothetical protein
MHSTCPAQSLPLTPQLPMTMYPGFNGTSLNFSFAQAFSSNWQQGDENIFSVKFSARSRDDFPVGPFTFKNSMNGAIGANYQDDTVRANTVRVGDNEIFDELVIVYPVSWKIDPYVAASVRTAITESFRYYGGSRFRTSSLWDPVTSRESTGFTWGVMNREVMFNARLGVALEQVRAVHQTLMTDDYKTFGIIEAYRAQSGVEFVSDAMYRGDSTLTYTGRFSLFSSFDEPEVWTVRWENETRIQLWKAIGLTWTFNVLHDVRQTRRTQFKQSIMLGLIQDF